MKQVAEGSVGGIERREPRGAVRPPPRRTLIGMGLRNGCASLGTVPTG